MLTWACKQKTRVHSSAEAELYGIGSGALEGLGVAILARVAVQSTTTSTDRLTDRT